MAKKDKLFNVDFILNLISSFNAKSVTVCK